MRCAYFCWVPQPGDTPVPQCRVHPALVPTSLVLLILRRISNHSPNPSPIFGKGLNRSSCRSFIKVRSGHQSPGVVVLMGASPHPPSKTFFDKRSGKPITCVPSVASASRLPHGASCFLVINHSKTFRTRRSLEECKFFESTLSL